MINLPKKIMDVVNTYDSQTGYYKKNNGEPDGIHTELEVLEIWYNLCRMIRPTRVIETGVYQGLSTCYLAAAMHDNGLGGKIYGIDPLPQNHLWIGTELEKYIEYLSIFSYGALPYLVGQEYDLLIVDSEHTYKTANLELVNFEPLVRPGGYIIMHDTLFHDGVAQAARALYDSPRFEVITFETPRAKQTPNIKDPVSMGLTIARKVNHGPPISTDPGWIGVGERDPVGPEPWLRRVVRRASDV
ncbi:class I SAM-dependent methyltransferase [Methylobacterium persicinum]|uniref:O-methyltransferase YrrM n=1 Tax=Methylobacterium persicinum TaxID=374426 RepID=A0ABU0HJM3_9HYPH|nr:class I SAM-dependent methyltransferase [Methylobacterium persicinum]MDQ0442516.1 putative O-methyltransferase YrrM [Methylobacterium persicinum]GJE37724.1 hypothetical protein KHHGKMAE_1785 [Methylobacterium persicinum]